MIERVVNPRNLLMAYRQVVSNQGSAGVDGMTVHDLSAHLTANREGLLASVVAGRYLPQAILGVEIPKANGKKRLLGIPTVTDRWLQQAVAQVLSPLFEVEFKDHSYGFRPGRNAQQAVLQAQQYINAGYQYLVDIDLQNFFDEVDHCLLLQLLYRKVKCPLTPQVVESTYPGEGQTDQTPQRRSSRQPAESPALQHRFTRTGPALGKEPVALCAVCR
jgi:group II intron reverse transcriptase/maturase